MAEGCCSWRRAGLYSLVFHIGVIICLGLVFNGYYMTKQPEVEYVIDLDAVENTRLGTNDQAPTPPEQLFPEPLPAAVINSRMGKAAAALTTSSTVPAAATDITVAAGTATGNTTIGDTSEMTGNSSGVSSGEGNGGSGDGDAITGGSGGGSAATGSSGDGSAPAAGGANGGSPFDLDGFADRVEASKEYPYMAVKRQLEGTVTMAVQLDANGQLVSLSVISSGGGILDKAALQAVRSACPYPNASGKSVSFTQALVFNLR
ncbi:energy transducer TonB [Pectinatus cerevisiiphilus]|uniref:TonB family protein n=1 Tax=Pectinatus cerevisiiphilus TaxID=86956 RepID=A0A4R3K9P9_9FIRM|nr:energy transducer TonB [Pectinatus cerevisiiphilus]TCS79603.1 TonB family protein [Pectinatus cerevisiiphilus]